MWEEIGNFLKGLPGSQTGNLLSGIGGALAQGRIAEDISALGKDATTAIYGQNYQVPEGGLLGEIGRQVEFRPFTVTTPTGSRATLGAGGMATMLSPTEQALQARMLGFGSEAFGMLGDPEARRQEQENIIGMLTQDPMQRATREQDIFGRMQATLAPEQERARLGLEERLANQGRLGVRTAMFGGTPEQLALEKAIAEQQAGLGVSAMEQARAEQALQSQQTLAGLGETRGRLGLLGELGLSSIPAAYAGQNQLLANLQPQLEAQRIQSALQATGLGLGAQLAESGLEAQLGYEALANAIRQQQFQGLFDLLKGEQAGQKNSSGSNNPLSFITDAATALTPLANRTAAQNASPSGDVTTWNDFFNWVNTGGGSS
jgi:hypothetical protein